MDDMKRKTDEYEKRSNNQNTEESRSEIKQYVFDRKGF